MNTSSKKPKLLFLNILYLCASVGFVPLSLYSSISASSESDYIDCTIIEPALADRGNFCSDIQVVFHLGVGNEPLDEAYIVSQDDSFWTISTQEDISTGGHITYVGPASSFKALPSSAWAGACRWSPVSREDRICWAGTIAFDTQITLENPKPEYFVINNNVAPFTNCTRALGRAATGFYQQEDHISIANNIILFNNDSEYQWIPFEDCIFKIVLNAIDTDLDGLPDYQEVEIGTSISDRDTDGDNSDDKNDAFPLDPTEWQDNDSDGIGDNADTDDDNDTILDQDEIANGTDPLSEDSDDDGVHDNVDLFPMDNSESEDSDNDGIGNNADIDDDNDTVSDETEIANGTNPLDADSDDDGTNDNLDVFPLDPSEDTDTDGDGIGNNADPDDDNDGVLDEDEALNNTNPLISDSNDDGYDDHTPRTTDSSDVFNALDPYYGNFSLYEGTNNSEYLNSDSYYNLSFLGNNLSDQRTYEDIIWVATCGNFGPTFFDYDFALLFDQIWFAKDGDDDIRIETWGSDTSAFVSGSYGDDFIFSEDSDIDIVSHGGFGNDLILIETNNNSLSKDRKLSLDEIISIEFFISDHDPCSQYLEVYKLTLSDRLIFLVSTEFLVLREDSLLEEVGISETIYRNYSGGSQSQFKGIYIWDLYNLFLIDNDGDDIPDFLDNDDDGDGIEDTVDAFPNDPTESVDSDNDGVGDNSDAFPDDASETEDSDADGIGNNSDAFPFDRSEWADTDSDGIGNNADTDDDNDSVPDDEDAFPLDPNESVDTDGDGIGNNTDEDDDNDSTPDTEDAFPLDPNESVDSDGDGIGNNADPDDDNDFMPDDRDAFPLDPNEAIDTDGDGIGNNADEDDDNDSVPDNEDAFPLDAGESTDSDGDGIGDNADEFPNDPTETTDTDSDGIGDNSDNCPNQENSGQLDTDNDTLGNVCDEDDDNDGVDDEEDQFPLDSTETQDTDGDGVGDNSDAFPNNELYAYDSDNDGMPDAWETLYGLDPNDPSDAQSDMDNDGIVAIDEFLAGTPPSGSLDIDGNERYDALTDGLLILRGMFGLDGSALTVGTIAADAEYSDPSEIKSRIDVLGELADIDGDGNIDALTDGLLILRYLFGLRGDALISGVIAANATRTSANEIQDYLDTLMPQ